MVTMPDYYEEGSYDGNGEDVENNDYSPPATDSMSQATRHARRVYVGGLSPIANEQMVATFFSHVMSAIGGNTAGPGDAVVNVYINHEKKFAIVEMRSVEEASNAIALDGIIFEGAHVKVRRPSDYNPSLAATLGPSQPNPNLNLGAVGLTPGSTGGLEGPDCIFVGGLPYYFTEAQIRELLESFGALREFDFVKDRETGNSKGYAFCVYQDVSVTDIACVALNGIKMCHNTLMVRRANQGETQPKPEQGAPVMVRRPSDYNPSLAATLGPCQPNPNLKLGSVGLTPGSAEGLEGPDCIFVGGLPYYFTEAHIREMLESFGALQGFDLVKDRETGNWKGFCVYQDLSVTDIACAALDGMKMGDKTLIVRRANQGQTQPKQEQESVLLRAQLQIEFQRLMLQPGAIGGTKVLCLTQLVNEDELKDDEDYEYILEDMKREFGKFGSLVNVVIPRPIPNGGPSPGLGRVFLEYSDLGSAAKARHGLNGIYFGGNQVVANFYPEDKFYRAEYDA